MANSDRIAGDPIRAFLKQLLSEREVDLAPLSVSIGKNRAYLQHYLSGERPRPRFLPRAVRIGLGRYFGIDPERFRHPEDPEAPPPGDGQDRALMHRAYAFAGTVIDRPEEKWEWLRIETAALALELFKLAQNRGVPILIDGEEMLPALQLFVARVLAHYGAADSVSDN
jgi:hypothetical protein